MSSMSVGELYVEIRPDTTNFARDLKAQVERDVEQFTQRMRARLSPAAFQRAEKTGVLAAAQRNFALVQETRYTQEYTAAQERANAAQTSGVGAAIRMRAGYAALGIAAVTVARGVDALGNAIKVTGKDAETTGGALRNMAAAAANLDVESFVKAGQIAFGRTFVPGGAAAADAAKAAEAREAEIQKAIALTKEYTTVQLQLKRATGEVGTAEGAAKYELQQRMRALRQALQELPAQQRRLGFAQQGLSDWAAPNPNRPRPGPTDQDFQLRVLRAQQTKATNDDLALQRDRAAFLRGLIRRAEEQGATTQEAKANLIRLYGLLDDAESSIAQMQEDNLRRRQERIAREIMLAEHAVSLQSANARTQGQEIAALQAQEALATQYAQDKRLTEEQRLQYELQAANAAKSRWQIEQQIAAERARVAEEQKRLAEQEKRENEEKLRRQREAAVQARELRLANAEAKAGLTKRLSDDKKAVKATIAYWKEVVATTAGLEREQARSQLISARGRLQSLNQQRQGGGATVGDFFREVLSDFRAFGSNYASTAAGMLSPQQARGAFAGDVLTRASRKTLDTALAEERTRIGRQSLAEQKRTNALLARIASQGGGKIDGSEYAGGPKVPPRVQNDVIRIAGAILNGV